MASAQPGGAGLLLTNAIDDLRCWCGFSFGDDQLGQDTRHAVERLHRMDPRRLGALVDEAVDRHLAPELKTTLPGDDDQLIFLERLIKTQREVTEERLRSIDLGIWHMQLDDPLETPTKPPPSTRPAPSMPGALALSPSLPESPSPPARPSLYPKLPPMPSFSAFTGRLLSSVTRSSPKSSTAGASGTFSSSFTAFATESDGHASTGRIETPAWTPTIQSGSPRQSLSAAEPSRSRAADSLRRSDLSSGRGRRPRQSSANQATTEEAVPLFQVSADVEAALRAAPADAFGVKWELLRKAMDESSTTVAFPPSRVDQRLTGPSSADQPNAWAAAHHADALADPTADLVVWQELDREHASALEGLDRSLGGCPTLNAAVAPPRWYGGRVRFVVNARVDDRSDKIVWTLRPPVIGPSCEARRRFGSIAFFEVQAPDVKQMRHRKQLFDLVSRPVDLLGSVWRAWYTEDTSVFFVRTNEPVTHTRRHPKTSAPRSPILDSLWSFYDWSGPFEENKSSTARKRVARLRLLLSSTVPVNLSASIEIVRGADRKGIPDIPADGPDGVMTDGSGLMSRLVALQVARVLDTGRAPSVVQARICGSKGTWTLDMSDLAAERPTITIRKSQLKVRHLPTLDPSFAVLHVNNVSKATSPGVLSWQIISVLSERRVPDAVFRRIITDDVEQLMRDLMMWHPRDGETPASARRRLILAVQRLGVLHGRIRREQGASARPVVGWREDDAAEPSSQASAYSTSSFDVVPVTGDGIDVTPFSGHPTALHETVLRKLTAGFLPHDDALLASDFSKVANTTLASRRAGFHVPCPESATMMMIPDPCDVLKPGEAFFCLSEPVIDPATGLAVDIPEGDVLFVRRPLLFTSSSPDELHLKDVVIFSTRGACATAALLGGGDYDGDRVTAIWHQPLVEGFTSADPAFAKLPFELSDIVDVETETVADLLSRWRSRPDRERAFQQEALRNLLTPGFHATYSISQTKSAYANGLAHPTTVRLAHIAALGLDSVKQGYSIKTSVERADQQAWGDKAMPPWYTWMKSARTDGHVPPRNEVALRRRPELGPHILDTLMDHMKMTIGRCLSRIEEQQSDVPTRADPDLVGPWNRFVVEADDDPAERNDREVIRAFVGEMRSAWSGLWRSPPRMHAGRKLPPLRYDETVAGVASRFHLDLTCSSASLMSRRLRNDAALLRRLKASLAYKIGHEVYPPKTRFAWDVAFADLCAIKAAAVDGDRPTVSVVADLVPALVVDKRFVEIPREWDDPV